MILLIGGTGTVGLHVTAALAERPNVRALARTRAAARRLAELGVEPVEGDLLRPETLARAFAGVRSVYLATPGERQLELESAAIDAAERAGIERIVKVSILHSLEPSPIAVRRAHHEIDVRLMERSPIAASLLCPSTFMTHFLWQADLIAEGRILFPAPNARIAYVDPRDVADVAVSVLTGESSLDGAHAVTGPEALSFVQVAERLSRKLAITVKYEEATADSFRARVLGRGGSEWLADGLLEIFLDFQRRGQMPVATTVAQVLGRAPRTLDTYIDDYLRPELAGGSPARRGFRRRSLAE